MSEENNHPKNKGKMQNKEKSEKPKKGKPKQGNIAMSDEYEIHDGKLVLKESYYERKNSK